MPKKQKAESSEPPHPLFYVFNRILAHALNNFACTKIFYVTNEDYRKGKTLKIELYLRNINQDMIDSPRVSKRPEWRVVIPIWKVHFMVPPAGKKGQKYLLRDEKEGGMLFDQKTSAVYKLDEEAYHTLIEMEHFEDLGKLAEKLNIEKEKVEQLKRKLEELNII